MKDGTWARRWTATSNRSYEPSEERQGVLATLALICTLLVLGVVLVAASPGAESEAAGESADTADRSDGGDDAFSTFAEAPSEETSSEETASEKTTGTVVPEDVSFLCGGGYGSEEINLEAEARDEVQEEVERYVLTVYGYSGDDAAEYERSVEDLVVDDCFWASPAGGDANYMEEVARGGGKANAPSGEYGAPTFARELSHFEVEYARMGEDSGSGLSFTKAGGTAVWVSEESNGDARGWQQSVELAKSAATGGEWRVLSGQTIPPTVDPVYEHYLTPDV